jgi:hypothetical protein
LLKHHDLQRFTLEKVKDDFQLKTIESLDFPFNQHGELPDQRRWPLQRGKGSLSEKPPPRSAMLFRWKV